MIEPQTIIAEYTPLDTLRYWLAQPPAPSAHEEVVHLLGHVTTLVQLDEPPAALVPYLDQLFTRSMRVCTAQLPMLHDAPLPMPRRLRTQVKQLQDLLERLADGYLLVGDAAIDDGGSSTSALALWRVLHLLHQHQVIAAVVATPGTPGIWRKKHRAFLAAVTAGLASYQPPGAQSSLGQEYLSSILLESAQPASFTPAEISFIANISRRLAPLVQWSSATRPEGGDAIFWVEPDRDYGPSALNRREPPPETLVIWVQCQAIVESLERAETALAQGASADQFNLPAFASLPAGRATISRLLQLWGTPAKRRFPRRRQNYRATLCAGISRLWQLLASPENEGQPLSSWMVVNESPDGYAVMHISGNTDDFRVGDLIGLKPDEGPYWHIGLIRWALSENPEHFEVGVQLLSPQAIPVKAGLPERDSLAGGPALVPALLLPPLANLRPDPTLVTPLGTLTRYDGKLLIVIDGENLEIREMRAIHCEEVTASVEIHQLQPDEMPEPGPEAAPPR